MKIQVGFTLIANNIDQSNCSFSGINRVYWCIRYITIIKNDVVGTVWPGTRRVVVRIRVCIHISFEHAIFVFGLMSISTYFRTVPICNRWYDKHFIVLSHCSITPQEESYMISHIILETLQI